MGRRERKPFSRVDIEALHDTLLAAFQPFLVPEGTITLPGMPPEEVKWWRASDHSIVVFDLASEHDPESAYRTRGGSCPVVELSLPSQQATGSCWWMSWQERWEAYQSRFGLAEAAMTFFWGRRRDRNKDQVLRAEWSEPPGYGGNAGQPHWHIDPHKSADPESSAGTGTAKFLKGIEEYLGGPVEIPDLGLPSPGREFSTSPLHLGMGGWDCTDIDSNAWQRRVESETRRLSEWAERTIEYVVGQLPLCTPL